MMEERVKLESIVKDLKREKDFVLEVLEDDELSKHSTAFWQGKLEVYEHVLLKINIHMNIK